MAHSYVANRPTDLTLSPSLRLEKRGGTESPNELTPNTTLVARIQSFQPDKQFHPPWEVYETITRPAGHTRRNYRPANGVRIPADPPKLRRAVYSNGVSW